VADRASDLALVRAARGSAGTGVVDGRVVDRPPRCSVCGKRLGDYFGRPWSIKCRNCGHQAKGD